MKDKSAHSVSALTSYKQIPGLWTAGNKPYNQFLILTNLSVKKIKILKGVK